MISGLDGFFHEDGVEDVIAVEGDVGVLGVEKLGAEFFGPSQWCQVMVERSVVADSVDALVVLGFVFRFF